MMLRKVVVKGFKSIRDQSIELGAMNILIGPNSAGKSNLVSIFRMVNFMLTDSLGQFVGREGGANSLLYLGAKTTPLLEITFDFQEPDKASQYYLRLIHAAQDTMIFADEKISYQRQGYATPLEISLGAGHAETRLREQAEQGDMTAGVMRRFLMACRAYQFHDTSEFSGMRQSVYIDDNKFLKSDAGNLAAYLYMLQEKHSDCYRRIIDTIQDAAPQFKDFDLSPLRLNPRQVQLQWKEKDSDYLFGPHQLSVGFLRFVALTTLLLQPEEDLPNLLVIDEPELGLHPAALAVLAEMLSSVSKTCQVLIATQSSTLLDHFSPSDIIVVERQKKETVFNRPNEQDLQEWITEYSTGELWQKNLLGGRP